MELTGRLLTNAFLTLGRTNNVDLPLTALAPDGAARSDAFGATVRQSRLGGALSVTEVLGATFVGDFDIDFFGGVQNGPGDRRLFPEPRLRTTRAMLRWPRTELMVGSDVPLVSQLNPVSVAASAIPDFSGAGNLWNWLAQLRLTQSVGTTTLARTDVRWALQGAVMTPYAGAQYPGDADAEDAGERSRRPAFEARLRAQWGDTTLAGATDASIADGGGEIGIGVHHGWVSYGTGALQTSRALAVDARISLLPRLELRGEAYTGQLLRGLGGGAIGQAYGVPATGETEGPPISDRAGWAQLNLQLHVTLLGGVGCGVDAVDPADRPARRRNTVCAGHLLWRPSEPILVGFELRRIATEFDTGATARATHLNLALGFDL
jgi:hypothetical protein